MSTAKQAQMPEYQDASQVVLKISVATGEVLAREERSYPTRLLNNYWWCRVDQDQPLEGAFGLLHVRSPNAEHLAHVEKVALEAVQGDADARKVPCGMQLVVLPYDVAGRGE